MRLHWNWKIQGKNKTACGDQDNRTEEQIK